MAAIILTYAPSEMKQYLEKEGYTLIVETRVFSNDNVYQSDFRLSGGKMDPPKMEAREVLVIYSHDKREIKCVDEACYFYKQRLLEQTFTELLRKKLLTL
jgi:hypothetical protein